ncbi:MFS transporter [Cellulomonas sp. IC4_254]|uniref:MFS transporter n=1 Tax=Cellulomonas sp. IC4_254 TaxID=2714040 RepID=UPI001423AADA|nr:MFS transporter [Cellulomonas sp. IC4_254]NHT18095.1 MFS transporter [Cellulomonas sp. IC4_254]
MDGTGTGARTARVAVGAAYAAQGFGYATVVTALPAFKERQGIDDTAVSLVVLLVCVAAAAGSVVAEHLATRRGSRTALLAGLAAQVVALPVVAGSTPAVPFVAGFALYGLGLGTVDAAAGVQGVLVQRRYGRPVMSGFFACYTAAAVLGALAMSALVGAVGVPGAASALVVAAAVLAGAVLLGRSRLVPVDLALAAGPTAPAGEVPAASAPPRRSLPTRGIWVLGVVVLAAFVADSAVSTWSTVYLHDVLLASAAAAPLGYAAYQAAVLVTRLAGDRLVARLGRAALVVTGAAAGTAGLLLVALVPAVGVAVAGFAVVGVAVGVLVPLAFSAAGDLDPARTDEVVARVNLFTYAGAVLGAVAVGLLADGPGLALGFLLPAVLVAPVAGTARSFARGGDAVARVGAH